MTHAQDVIRESEKVPTLNARMGTGGNQVPILLSAGFKGEQSASARGLGYKEEQCPTLTTATPPDVMTMENIPKEIMSTTGGQKCWTTSKASFMTHFIEGKAQTLVATDWKDAPVLVTENKQLEVCAPMMDEDSTDKMSTTINWL